MPTETQCLQPSDIFSPKTTPSTHLSIHPSIHPSIRTEDGSNAPLHMRLRSENELLQSQLSLAEKEAAVFQERVVQRDTEIEALHTQVSELQAEIVDSEKV